jgi:hypothetical protein
MEKERFELLRLLIEDTLVIREEFGACSKEWWEERIPFLKNIFPPLDGDIKTPLEETLEQVFIYYHSDKAEYDKPAGPFWIESHPCEGEFTPDGRPIIHTRKKCENG